MWSVSQENKKEGKLCGRSRLSIDRRKRVPKPSKKKKKIQNFKKTRLDHGKRIFFKYVTTGVSKYTWSSKVLVILFLACRMTYLTLALDNVLNIVSVNHGRTQIEVNANNGLRRAEESECSTYRLYLGPLFHWMSHGIKEAGACQTEVYLTLPAYL